LYGPDLGAHPAPDTQCGVVRSRWQDRGVAENGQGQVHGDGAAPGDRKLPSLERGQDLSRIVAFTDGVFAIAITLLVLQIDVPTGATSASDLWDRLGDQTGDFVAYAVSFLVIGSFWIRNHRFMRMVHEFDRGLLVLLLPYLGVMVLIPFSSQLMGEYGDRFDMTVILYMLNMVAMGLAGIAMSTHVLKRGLAKPEYEWDVALTRKSSFFAIGLFALTIPLVFILGPWTPALWLLLRLDPFDRRRARAYAD
jgi:uncharacterized membrane protein